MSNPNQALLQLMIANFGYDMIDEEENSPKERKTRTERSRPWLSSNPISTNIPLVYIDIKAIDEEKFTNSFRMSRCTFAEILERIKPHIEKQETVMRTPISAEIWLIITLVYLGNGPHMVHMEKTFRISKVTICKIIPEVCDALWHCYAKDSIKLLQSSAICSDCG